MSKSISGAYDNPISALSEYVERCGYVPLALELSAAELAQQWCAQHAGAKLEWDALWAWAEEVGTPMAKYHAVTVALHLPDARPKGSMELLWGAVVEILDVTEASGDAASTGCVWQLYCELAGHYIRHVEALHPGQHGERVACYGWWLASKTGRLLGFSERGAKSALDRVVRPAAGFSFSRWLIARSPVVPSAFRYCSLYMSSVWAMSLLAQLSLARASLALGDLPAGVRDAIGTVLRGYLLASPLANKGPGTLAFGFQNNGEIVSFCGDVLPVGEFDAFSQLVQFRNSFTTPADLMRRLERLSQEPIFEQNLTMMIARDAGFCRPEFDEALGGWLERPGEASKDLTKLQSSILGPLLDVLAEFHQRQQADWGVRLPLVLSYAIEQADDEATVNRLFLSLLFMSVNGGVASPIERVMSSKWRSSVIGVLQAWRENAVSLAAYSEPWVAGRVRATSAVISRLIGPRPATGQSSEAV